MNLNFQLLIIVLFDFFHEDENIEKNYFCFVKLEIIIYQKINENILYNEYNMYIHLYADKVLFTK